MAAVIHVGIAAVFQQTVACAAGEAEVKKKKGKKKNEGRPGTASDFAHFRLPDLALLTDNAAWIVDSTARGPFREFSPQAFFEHQRAETIKAKPVSAL
jgi:hypothetical protein